MNGNHTSASMANSKKNTPNSQCLFTYCTEFKKVLGGYSELYLMLKRGETSLESRCSTINKFFFRYWQRKQISETALRESSFHMTTGGGGGGGGEGMKILKLEA